MELLRYPHPALAKRASEVTVFDDELKRLVDEMTVVMRERSGVGLAGNQVGLDKRIMVYRDQEYFGHLVNPILVSHSGKVTSKEGCLSFPGICIELDRFELVEVQGFNVLGEPITVQASGILAVCLQHELDHLNGITFLDHLPKLKRELVIKKLQRGKTYAP
jgi:peptide deformylase